MLKQSSSGNVSLEQYLFFNFLIPSLHYIWVYSIEMGWTVTAAISYYSEEVRCSKSPIPKHNIDFLRLSKILLGVLHLLIYCYVNVSCIVSSLFLSLSCPSSCLLPFSLHRLAPVFSLFVPFYLLIPSMPVTQVLGHIHITNKSLVYVVGLQVSLCFLFYCQ